MKRKQLLHKSMAVLTALTLMATAFTGCGSGSATKQDDSAQSTDAESQNADNGADGSDPFAFESAKDVVFPLKEKLTLTVFVNNPDQSVTSYQDNWVTDWIEEQTNIHLDYVYD